MTKTPNHQNWAITNTKNGTGRTEFEEAVNTKIARVSDVELSKALKALQEGDINVIRKDKRADFQTATIAAAGLEDDVSFTQAAEHLTANAA